MLVHLKQRMRSTAGPTLASSRRTRDHGVLFLVRLTVVGWWMLLLAQQTDAWSNQHSSRIPVSSNNHWSTCFDSFHLDRSQSYRTALNVYKSSSSTIETESYKTGTNNMDEEAMELNNSFFSQLQAMPKLLVFDLDNTLWTPELYQLRKPRNAAGPSVDRDIRLFEDARRILDYFAAATTKVAMATPQPILPKLAVASRTSRAKWAHQLLDDFKVGGKDEKVPLRELFPYIEIQTGSKKRHFASLRETAGLTYSEMLFFDDSVSMNLNEISQLGVLCCHTPRGMTMPHFIKALQKYNELKAGKDARHWMGYVLNNDNLGIHNNNVASDRRGSTVNGSRRQQNGQSSSPIDITPGKLYQGRIKFFSAKKRFGFVVMEEGGDNLKTADYFFHESHVPDDMIRTLRAGDQVSFHLTEDSRTAGRWSATLQSVASSSVAANNNTVGGGRKTNEKMVEMPCFSMSQPFVRCC